jgi:hypothetical protein
MGLVLSYVERSKAGVKRLIEAEKPGQAVAVGSKSEREAYAEALRRRADLVMAGTDEAKLHLAGDVLAG